MPAATSTVRLAAGVVAYNEAGNIRAALRSLLDQELPAGARWGTIWVVASGCTDGTAEAARTVDPRVEVLEEPVRRGKSAALVEVFRRAQGDYLVLLNADARAEPGAIAELLRRGRELAPPFAIMGRPVPPATGRRGFADAVRLLWEIHHQFHAVVLERGQGTHLSDELLLLPLSDLPPVEPGVVNDGAFLGAWLSTVRGRLAYAPDARVEIQVPEELRDHVWQRRRIVFGHSQVREILGVRPTTLGPFALRHPGAAVRLLVRSVRSTPRGLRALVRLTTAELVAGLLARWDRIPPRRDHTLWVRVGERSPSRERTAP
ncbi:MAG TPA: glycosyltransferase [Thermoplasmata archaeon]|nr:glycosyltransferase [Thermoplasmata archaeon]